MKDKEISMNTKIVNSGIPVVVAVMIVAPLVALIVSSQVKSGLTIVC